jgi:alpha-glucosidase
LGGGDLGKRRARAFALLTHALPGGCYIYQGEELGLSDGLIPDSARQDPVYFRTKGVDKGRDGARVPMPWSNEESFGFTRGKPWLPMTFNSNESVTSQMEDEKSSLNLYHSSLEIRNSHPALKKSTNQEIAWLETQPGVIGFKREPGLIVFANTTDQDLLIPLEIQAKLLIGSSPEVKVNGTELHLAKDSTCWLTM